ncbi:MAG TPA: glycosyl transferase, partial [Thermodesulfobacteriota bacterium]|nr:glycosyl transferase [Thermodesulfobacteriota bacterium]
PHGLPLIGTGDWNDGLNRVGAGGKGESIWLGWFICAVLAAFEPICRTMGDDREAAFCRESAKTLQHALETHGWDGAWYRRGYYDDTGTLGSAKDAECRIDSIAQSWAVISGAGAPERTQEAMKAVVELLISERDDLIQLLTPPFDKVLRDPGYIKGYPPGVRENGGQYTHAALWVVWAFAMLGDGDRAQNLFRMLNPVYHCDTPEKVSAYRVEPYVVAADVYSVPPFTGRGGWTWYTGSGGWMYRLGLEAILGLRRSGTDLIVHPCIPRAWKHYEIRYKAEKTECHIQVENPNGVNQGVKEILVDGTRIAGKKIALASDGKEHRVEVTMG